MPTNACDLTLTCTKLHLISVEVGDLAVDLGGPAQGDRLDTPVGGRVEELRPGRGGGAGHGRPAFPGSLTLRSWTAELQPEVSLEPRVVDVTFRERENSN